MGAASGHLSDWLDQNGHHSGDQCWKEKEKGPPSWSPRALMGRSQSCSQQRPFICTGLGIWATLLTKSGHICRAEEESSERHEVSFTRFFQHCEKKFPHNFQRCERAIRICCTSAHRPGPSCLIWLAVSASSVSADRPYGPGVFAARKHTLLKPRPKVDKNKNGPMPFRVRIHVDA